MDSNKKLEDIIKFYQEPGFVYPEAKPERPIADQYQDYKQVQDIFEPRTQMYIEKEMGFADGGMLVKPSDDGSRPGYASPKGTKTVSLFAETGLDEHRGITKTIYPSGKVSYRGNFTRTKTGGRQTTPFRSTIEEVRVDLDEALKTPKGKTAIDIQKERGAGKQLEDPKYKAELKKAYTELELAKDKGYINLDEFVEEYAKKFRYKKGTKNPITGAIIKTSKDDLKSRSVASRGISKTIRDRAKELNIYNLEKNKMHDALEAYAKIKNRKPGDITRLAKQYKVSLPEYSQFITRFGLREYLPKNRDETRLAQSRAEQAAMKKYSSGLYEKELKGTVDIHKSHMGDKYNMPVRTSTIDYAPGKINKFLADKYDDLKIGMSIDAVLKNNTRKLKNLYRNKPPGYKQAMDRINQKGTEIAMATRGFKKFESIDPNTGKTFVIEGAQRRGGLDPSGLLGDRKLSDLDKTKGSFDREMVQYLKRDAMKAAKMSNPQIKREIKLIQLNLAKQMKAQGFKCKVTKANGGVASCNNPRAYLDDIAKQREIARTGSGKQAINAARKLSGLKTFMTSTLGPGAIAGEIAFAVPFALSDYASGESTSRIINNATFGAFGENVRDEIVKYGGEEAGLALDAMQRGQQLQEVESQADLFQGPDDSMMYPDILKGAQQRFDTSIEPFMKTDPSLPPGIGLRYFDDETANQYFNKLYKAQDDIAQTKARLKQERTANPYEEAWGAADGGIARIRRPHAIAPISGPAPQGEGLSYLFNRDREW